MARHIETSDLSMLGVKLTVLLDFLDLHVLGREHLLFLRLGLVVEVADRAALLIATGNLLVRHGTCASTICPDFALKCHPWNLCPVVVEGVVHVRSPRCPPCVRS